MSNRIEELEIIAQSLTNVIHVTTNTPVQGVPVGVVNNTIHYLDALLNITMKELENEKASTETESPVEVKASRGKQGKRKGLTKDFGAGV